MNIMQAITHLVVMKDNPNKMIGTSIVSELSNDLARATKYIKEQEALGKSRLKNPVSLLYISVFNDKETQQISYSIYNRYTPAPNQAAETELVVGPITLLDMINAVLEKININQIVAALSSFMDIDKQSKDTFLAAPLQHLENFTKLVYEGLEQKSQKAGKDLSFLIHNNKRDKYGRVVPSLFLMHKEETIEKIEVSELAEKFLMQEEEPKKKT